MNTRLTDSIAEKLKMLDEGQQTEVLHFVEALSKAGDSSTLHSVGTQSSHEPTSDVSDLLGSLPPGEDGVVFQRRVRDHDWP